jgi:hypothetical protein
MGKTLLESLGATDEEIKAAKADTEIASYGSNYKEEEIPVQEAAFEAEQVHNLARTSLDFLAALAAPVVFRFCFPPVFVSVWLWLLDELKKPRSFPQLALGLPRGFGKTTVIKLFVLYCILFTNKKSLLFPIQLN